MSKIESFKGKYAFLSNFWPVEVCLPDQPGINYASTEHAYQAAKCINKEDRQKFIGVKAAAAKKIGQKLDIRKDWESVKVSIMLNLIRRKFKHPDLKALLIETGDAELIEGNWWGDTFWGVSNGVGENHLGKLLMQVRKEIMTPRPDDVLLTNLKAKLPELKELLIKTNGEWNYEDMVYRFYHQSFKVYYVQGLTDEIVKALKSLVPDAAFNKWFDQLIAEGTNKNFKMEHNEEWLKHTRPMLEAFFHAKYFLEMAVKYGKELEEAPNLLPSGWAAFLYLYSMR